MRRIVVSEYVSLDGIMEDPGGAEKFKYGGWTVPYWDDDMGKLKYTELFSSGLLLLGRRTYEEFAKAWPTMEGTGDFGERMNGIDKVAVSASMKQGNWGKTTLIKDSVAAEIAKLKNQPGQDILVFGSATLVQTLLQNDLVDQYDLLMYPVVLGEGKRLFQDGAHTNLKLSDVKTFPSGVMHLRYLSAGKKEEN